MVSLANHQSSDFTKLIYLGDSGTGKTGSLVSLVKAGYKLKILDTDNGLDSLKAYIKHECPDKIGNVDFESRRDTYTPTINGPIIQKATAFVDSMKLMTKWSDDSTPGDWGKDTFFVLDSLTGLGKAAFEFAKGLNPSSKDPRQWYFTAQQSIESVIANLTGDNFKCNLIVITHVALKELTDGTTKGYPTSVGSALGSTVPKYFNTMVVAERVGSGTNVKRRIKTAPTELLDLKTAAPFAIEKDLPLETGLATLVAQLKAN